MALVVQDPEPRSKSESQVPLQVPRDLEQLPNHEVSSLLKTPCTLEALIEELDEVDAIPSSPNYSNFDLFCTFISIVTYIFDLVMDTIVAAYFYHLGVTHGIYHYWYFGLTVAFILLPSLTMTGFSFRWYLMDADNTDLPPVPTWRWILRLIVLMLQIAPVLRYLDSMANGIRSRYFARVAAKAKNIRDRHQARRSCLKYYTLMVYEDADATLLRLFECFMESAPQLVLQMYILIRDPHAIQLYNREFVGDEAVDPILKLSILCLSVISSLISLAWSLVVYHRSLRYTYTDKENIRLAGSICQFFWHFSSITARVLALSLFASIYPKLVGPVCAAHWVLMSSWVIWQKTSACNSRCEEFVFCLALGTVYIFSFFNAKEEHTRYKYLLYYLFCFCENTVLIILWFIHANANLPTGQEYWYYYPGILGHYAMFFGGIFFMVLYYSFFHPTGIHPRARALFSKRPGKKAGSKDDPNEKETPAFIDLREIRSDLHDLGARPLSGGANSVSSPALDEIDLSSSSHKPEDHVNRELKRASSAPNPGGKLVFRNTRSFKYMLGK